jgi:hypothetical protein
MRINVYTEELPNGSPMPNCEVVTAEYVSARTGKPMTNYGLRIFLRSPDSLHFIPGRDDDRSAVTFWCGDKQANLMQLVTMLKQCVEIDNLERFRATVAKANTDAERAEAVGKYEDQRAGAQVIGTIPAGGKYPDDLIPLDPVAMARMWERGEEPEAKLSKVYPPVTESNPD